MKQNLIRILIVFFLLLPQIALGQVKKDKKSEEYFAKGVKLFTEQNYPQAYKQFIQIQERPFNRVYTAGIYMTALTLFYNEEYDLALSKFQQLLNQYPQSAYTNDASYHKALIMLKKTDSRLGGLYLLNKLMEEGENDELKTDARKAFQTFLYEETDTKFLKEYYEFIGKDHPNRALVLEAFCYKLYKDKNWDEINRIIQEYKFQNGIITNRLKHWDTAPVKEKKKNNKVRIAAILPFQASKSVTQLNVVASWAVELLEGMQLSVLMNQEPMPVDIIVRAYDSKNEVKTIESLLANEIKEFKPDIIIGDVKNDPTRVLAQYSEQNKIIQFIPISPVEGLVEGKKYVYLLNSSMKTQMTGLAKYATEKLTYKKFMLVGDNTPLSDAQLPLFESVLKEKGLKITIKKTPVNLEKDNWYFKTLAGELLEKQYDALFIASNNETIVNSLLTALKSKNTQLTVFGSTDWGRFKTVDSKLLSQYNATFSDGYFIQNDTSQFNRFSKQYSETFKQLPSRYACLGYDIMSYLISLKPGASPSVSLNELIEKATPYKGLIQNYYFAKAQDNQSLQLLQYRNGKIEKIKTW
jgi:ABC-type branched-subunit amino acid transport system substrate-binding protein